MTTHSHDPAAPNASKAELVAEIERLRAAQKDQRLNENMLKALLDAPTEINAVIDRQGAILHINHMTAGNLGSTTDELVGRNIWSVLPSDIACHRQACARDVIRTGLPVRFEDERNRIHYDNIFYPVLDDEGRVCRIIICARDISERKSMQQSAIRSEKILRATLEATADGILVVDDAGMVTHANQRFAEMWQIPPDILATNNNHTMLTSVLDQLEEPEDFLAEIESAYQTSTIFNKVRRFKDGRVFEQFSYPLFTDYHRAGRVWSFRDITQREQTQQALREREATYRTIFETTGTAMMIIEPDHHISLVNTEFEALSGYPRHEVEGHLTWMDFIEPSPARAGTYATIDQIPRHHEISFRDKQGYQKCILVTAAPLPDSQRRVASLLDISPRKLLENQIVRTQKLEALGTLAGGIAHDFNNILAAIMGYAELLRQDLDGQGPADGRIDRILEACTRARDLVRQILTFSRQVENRRRPVQIHTVVEEALQLLGATIPSTIQIRRRIDPHSGQIMADPSQIHQVMLNLCTNALHATSDQRGTITVELEPRTIDAAFVDAQPQARTGRFIRLRVRDNGCGMDRATIERIFDPFFSTKETGKGTGLGLATVHGIVTSLEGFVIVESTPGRGSTFDVYLPQCAAAAPPATGAPTPIPRGSGEHVLLVDDEEAIVDIQSQILQSLGYTITAATGSREALQTFRQAPHSFDLVITDMTMPHMTGAEMALEIMRIRPDTPVIVCTGYSEIATTDELRSLGIRECLSKPVQTLALARSVRNVLD